MRGTYDRKRMVICDTDERYVTRMSEYFTGKEEFPFALWFFQSLHELMEYGRENPIYVLVLQEELWKECGGIEAENVFLLTRDPERCRGGTPEKDSMLRENPQYQQNLQYLYRYQSAEDILQTIYQRCTVRIVLPTKAAPDSQCQMIGFFTPIGRCLQTTAALTLGQLLARKEKVLYLNLKGCDDILSRENRERYDLSDLIYCYLHSKKSFLSELSTMRQTINKLEVMEAARTYMDIQAVAAEDWIGMLQEIRDSGLYGRVILDLSTQVQGFLQVLQLCDKIYTMELPDRSSAHRMKQYEKMLEFVGAEEILHRTVRVLVPEEIWRDSFEKLPEHPEEYPYSCVGMLMNHLNA